MLKINLEYRKGILFIRLKGNLNINTTPKFIEYTYPIINDYGIKYMVYNLDELNELDEKGIKALEDSGKSVKENNGRILIINNSNKNITKFENISDELMALKLLKI